MNENDQIKTVGGVLLPPISIVIPLFNELECLDELYSVLDLYCRSHHSEYEIILVDDGSTDNSVGTLKALASSDVNVRIVVLQRNFGQTAAMSAGINRAKHDFIITMDGDLQNDPNDIPLLLNALNDDLDVISGWRRKREDKALTRRIPSQIANWLIGRVTGLRLHDYGCSLKAYRARAIKNVRLYGDLHRFIPALCALQGAKVEEVVVSHHPRKTGYSKYGLGRTFRVIVDLLTVKFLLSYGTRPMHFFGGAATIFFIAAVISMLVTIIMKSTDSSMSINRNPIFYLSVLMSIGAVQMLSIGLLAELIMRTYYESQGKSTYIVKHEICALTIVPDNKSKW